MENKKQYDCTTDNIEKKFRTVLNDFESNVMLSMNSLKMIEDISFTLNF